jgi:hypothetical protein
MTGAKAKDYTGKNLMDGLWSDDKGSGERVDLPRRRERLESIAIDTIRPDPAQPRRAIPSEVRNFGAGLHPWRLLVGWMDMVSVDADTVQGLIAGGVEIPDDYTPAPLEGGLLALASLAASIYRGGLTNPVTLTPDPSPRGRGEDTGYLLETGERRWLAFHLLNGLGFAGYELIPARVVDRLDVWRQATENNTREDLNAIGRARQFAILLMDLLGRENFRSLDTFPHEQDYYAQVEDGAVWRIPHGASQRLVDAMGLKNPRQLRDYRALLRLPRAVWVQADDENWTEFAIRDEKKSVPTGTELAGKASSQLTLWSVMGDGYKGLDRALKRAATWTGATLTDPSSRKEKLAEAQKIRDAMDDLIRRLETPPPAPPRRTGRGE